MKLTVAKTLCFLSTSLLLVACGNNNQEEPEQNGTIEEPVETPTGNDDTENSEDNGAEEAQDNDENLEDIENDNTASDDESNENTEANNEQNEEDETQEQQDYLSDIISLNEEDRLAHHQSLAARPEHLSDSVYENLLLPGIHENTVVYEGRVNSGDGVMIEFPDAEETADRTTTQPEVSEDGYFTVELNEYNFEAGENIRIYIHGSYPHEQTFNLPIHEAQDGMEEIRVRE